VHLRLRRDFPLASLPNDGARTVAVALQRYGMFLADGRKHRPDRAQRPHHHRQVGRPARAEGPAAAQGHGLRDGGPRLLADVERGLLSQP
jgi:hypothetical protein